MDEPFGALDPITRAELQREFLALQKRMEKTIVFVTHDLREALLLGTRIGLMESGCLVTIESRDDFSRSSQPLVKAYLDAFNTTFDLQPGGSR
jgi:osmoprotectant transport system ATP-binding protein